jgi:SAM-dependent methyltransferase
MQGQRPVQGKRTPEQIREHYEIEKELANRLRNAPRSERASLYAAVYDELFRRVPHHPQWTKQNNGSREKDIAAQVRLLRPYLTPGSTFLEVGAGDCMLSRTMAALVSQSYAVDVSSKLLGDAPVPANFRLVLSGGCDITLPDESVDLAYSYQLMEHIHPDDAADQVHEILRVLKPGGRYLCITPSRLSGPHDISIHFDTVATGFHLKEYSIGDLADLFKQAGFERVMAGRQLSARAWRVPVGPLRLIEQAVGMLPPRLRQRVCRTRLMGHLLNVTVIAFKGASPRV